MIIEGALHSLISVTLSNLPASQGIFHLFSFKLSSLVATEFKIIKTPSIYYEYKAFVSFQNAT